MAYKKEKEKKKGKKASGKASMRVKKSLKGRGARVGTTNPTTAAKSRGGK